MESYVLAKFPQEKFRFELYDNTECLTWQEIKQKTGCYALCNLWYFSLHDYTHQVGVMLEGKWVRPPQYTWPGMCVSKNGKVTTGGTESAVWGYAASVQADYLNSRKNSYVGWEANGVTYTGLTPAGDVVVLICSRDTPMDSATAVQTMLDAGCADILRWDGSWSSQGSLGPGLDVQPSEERICRGWLLIFERKEEENDMDEITLALMEESACYKAGRKITPKGIMVHSTATPGAMAEQIRENWNKPSSNAAVHAIIDDKHTLMTLPWSMRGWHAGSGSGGSSANNTHISFEVCEPDECRLIPIEWVTLYQGNKGNPAWAVKQLQMELQARGYDPNGIDGSFGPGCKAALMQFQKDAGLTVDGYCGPATREALATRSGSYMQYRPQVTDAYFRAVWGRAVALCAKLCNVYQLNPLTDIICHAEGYRKGIASNHADVEHWWPLHGKTMDDFRKEVRAVMLGEDIPESPEQEKPWYEDAQNWVKQMGISDGSRPADPVTRAEVWTMLKRYDEAKTERK